MEKEREIRRVERERSDCALDFLLMVEEYMREGVSPSVILSAFDHCVHECLEL